VAKPVEEGLAERERDELRGKIVQGCREMSDVYQEIDQEWSCVSDEVWRDLE